MDTRWPIFAAGISVIATPALAEVDLSDLVGFTLVQEKTIVGRIENGKYEEGYEGCTYGRILVFDDETGVECAEYNYQYAYRPTAFIFARGSSLKVVVDDDVMDVRQVY